MCFYPWVDQCRSFEKSQLRAPWGVQSSAWASWRVRSWFRVWWGALLCSARHCAAGLQRDFVHNLLQLPPCVFLLRCTIICVTLLISDGQISKLNNTLKKAEKKCLAENSIGMSILALCHTISVRWVWRWLLQDSDHHEDECVMMRRQSRFESSAMLDRFWGTAKRSNNLRHLLELEEELREISGEPVAGWE